MPNLPFAKKSLGQHWLTDAAALQAMLSSANVSSEDTVLEIGPGPGSLTKMLARQAHHVVAVEYDDKLAQDLPRAVPSVNLTIVQKDILRFDFSTLPADYKIVANIPYYLTGNLLRVISETSNRAICVALLVQKEVAERVAAQAGDMSLLSVTCQYYWLVSAGPIVSRRLFTPEPKVDSQILILTRRDIPLFRVIDEASFFRLVKAGFAARRKTILNSLSGGLRRPKEDILKVISAAGLKPTMRPQELTLEQWHALFIEMYKA